MRSQVQRHTHNFHMRHVMAYPQGDCNESIEEYIDRYYNIVTGKASTKELPVKTIKVICAFLLIPHYACFFKISEKILYWK